MSTQKSALEDAVSRLEAGEASFARQAAKRRYYSTCLAIACPHVGLCSRASVPVPFSVCVARVYSVWVRVRPHPRSRFSGEVERKTRERELAEAFAAVADLEGQLGRARDQAHEHVERCDELERRSQERRPPCRITMATHASYAWYACMVCT